jgi:hypothetical protein
MIIDSITQIPVSIRQHFDPKLLSCPVPKLRDSCDCIQVMLNNVEKLWYKLQNNPERLVRCEALKKEIMVLYERAKIKEKERESQKDHKTQEFGYHVALPKTLDRDVYWRLRFGRKGGSFKHKFRGSNAISKIQKAQS